jgi:hypothetical protein
MNELRWSVRVVLWSLATVAIGVAALWRLGITLSRWPRVLAETLPCPRGHATPMYGVFRCKCGAAVEGWAFALCPVCGQSAGWTPCRVCGLPITNPMVK